MNALAVNPKLVLSVESADLLEELKSIHTRSFMGPNHILTYLYNPYQTVAKKLKAIDSAELFKVLECFFRDQVQEGKIKDPARFCEPLTALIPFKKLQEAVKADVGDALRTAKSLADEAKLYLQLTQGSASFSIQDCYISVLQAMLTVIESLVSAFGIADFFKPAESEIRADFKSNKIFTLISLFSMVTTLLLPLMEAATAAVVIGSAILSVVLLSLVWPVIKPATSYLPGNAVNWTAQCRGKPSVIQGRKESLDEIATILNMNRHAILVGPSRVGKSLTAKAFAQAVERGDYPELKGKTVFRINTSDLIDQKASFLGGSSTILNEISSAMGRHRKEIILVLDEIHMACKNDEKTADQLKTFLDEGGEFSHVIGITTEEEYEKHVKNNQAFSLRFDRVDIRNTSRDETIKILAETVLRSGSRPLIREGSFDQIYDQSFLQPSAPQPVAAIKLLKRCIHRTEQMQRSSTEKKIIEVSNRIQAIQLQAAATPVSHKDMVTQIDQLQQELQVLRRTLSQEQQGLDKLLHSKQLLRHATEQMYSSVLKITGNDEKQLNLFLLLREFLGKSLESFIEQRATHFSIRPVIDHTLIEEEAEAAGYKKVDRSGLFNLVKSLFVQGEPA